MAQTADINTAGSNICRNKNACLLKAESLQNLFTLILHNITMESSRFITTKVKLAGNTVSIHFSHCKNKPVKIRRRINQANEGFCLFTFFYKPVFLVNEQRLINNIFLFDNVVLAHKVGSNF